MSGSLILTKISKVLLGLPRNKTDTHSSALTALGLALQVIETNPIHVDFAFVHLIGGSKALKAHFSRSLRVCCFTKKIFIVSKHDFARVVKEPFEFAFSMANLKSGFSKCGIYPFNRNTV